MLLDALDNPAWTSLTGAHREYSTGNEQARRYQPDVNVFAAVARFDDDGWAALADLLPPGEFAVVCCAGVVEVPAPFDDVYRDDAPQLVLWGEPSPVPLPTATEIVELGPDDHADMRELAHLTKPGPFSARTPLLGRFVGVRRNGRLVAMAGERLHPTGATEVSAVCTHPDGRGSGLAAALTAAVARRIIDRGEVPFLHTTSDNEAARRVYRRLGFEVRTTMTLVGIRRT